MTFAHSAGLRSASALLLLASTGALSPPAASAQPATAPVQVPSIPVTQFVLPNGLTVLLSENHSAPITAVVVWYHVGSRNERAGRSGFAHFFEHMMFTGSQHVPEGQHFKILESIGADLNGTTNNDRTLYYEVVPSNETETALWLESDRMGFLPPAMTEERLSAQRNIVQNERRQGVDNQPFGLQNDIVYSALFPPENPYSWSVIGSLADLQAASMADVKGFFGEYYAPNNATLSIVGDFKPAAVKALVERYFGDIPRGPAITRAPIPAAKLVSEKRLVLEDARTSLPQMRILWPTVGTDNADRYALSALSSILTADRTSRLTKLLVHERQLVTNVGAFNTSYERAGFFAINVVPRPNASLTQIETVIDSVLSSLVVTPPTPREVGRARNFRTVSAVTGLQSDLQKAMTLADGASTYGDPLATFKQIPLYAAVTPADVQRVVRQYLTNGRVVLSMVPAGKLETVAKPSLPYKNVTPATPAPPAKP